MEEKGTIMQQGAKQKDAALPVINDFVLIFY